MRRAHHTLSFQLSGAQLGISITTLITGYLTEPLVAELPHPAMDALGVPDRVANAVIAFVTLLVVTSLSMIFGELVPKNLAVARPLQTARAVAGLQLLFSWLMTWPIRLTNGVANWVLRKLGIEPAQELRSARSAQELVSLVRNSARSGSLDPATAALLDRSLQFGDLTAEELMTPRSKIVALQVDNTVADLVEAAAESGFSRFPVVDGDLDETVGIVHVKQVFGVPAAERELTLVTAVAQPVAKVPSTLDGDALMGQIRANDLQTAMVVDEYGGTAGMVTVEDLIEEIVGDVRDEHDDAAPGCSGSRQRLAGVRSAAHRRGGHRDRLPRPRGRIRDDRRAGHATAGPHSGHRRRGAAEWIRARRRPAHLGLAGQSGSDGRPPHRPARADPAVGSRRFRFRARPMMGDLLELLATILLVGANAFFVAAEFSLISARRDRLEALAEQGRSSAVTALRAGEQLPLMFAGAQLGITIASLMLGRLGEPAVADLLQRPFDLLGVSPTVLHTLSFVMALAIVVTLHVLLGEMVPKNIAIAGPEKAAMLLIPAYLAYVRTVRPILTFYNWCTGVTLRALRVQPRDELEVAVSTVELSEMIAESVSEGLLDPEEHNRLTRALQIRNRTVADVAVPVGQIHAVPVAAAGSGPTVGIVEKALAATGYSRFPVVDNIEADRKFLGYLHIKDVLSLAGDPHAVIDLARVRPLPRVSQSLTVPEALSRMRRSNSHLALVTGQDGAVVAMVALEDLVRDLVGLVRDGTQRA